MSEADLMRKLRQVLYGVGIATALLTPVNGPGTYRARFAAVAWRLVDMRSRGLVESERGSAGRRVLVYWRLTPAGREAVRS